MKLVDRLFKDNSEKHATAAEAAKQAIRSESEVDFAILEREDKRGEKIIDWRKQYSDKPDKEFVDHLAKLSEKDRKFYLGDELFKETKHIFGKTSTMDTSNPFDFPEPKVEKRDQRVDVPMVVDDEWDLGATPPHTAQKPRVVLALPEDYTHVNGKETDLAEAIKKSAKDDDMRAREEAAQEREAQSMRFDNDGALGKYILKTPAKDLAVALDRHVKSFSVDVGKQVDHEVTQHFSPEILNKMEEVGRALSERFKQRSTMTGKVIQKIGDYAAFAANAFKKLAGKKVDDPALAAACKEVSEKMQKIKEKGPDTKSIGDFTSKVLEGRQKQAGVKAHRE